MAMRFTQGCASQFRPCCVRRLNDECLSYFVSGKRASRLNLAERGNHGRCRGTL